MTTTNKLLDEKQRKELTELYNSIGSGLTFADQILFPEEQRFMRSFNLKERLQRMYPEDASQISDEDFDKELYDLDIFISRLENRLYLNYQDSQAIPFIHVALTGLRNLKKLTGLEMWDRWFSVKSIYAPREAARIIRELVADLEEYLQSPQDQPNPKAPLMEDQTFLAWIKASCAMLDDGIDPSEVIPDIIDAEMILRNRILKFPLEEILHIQGAISRLTQIEMVARAIGEKNG